MAARCDAGGVDKVFGHCEITWEVENYYLATFGENWIINSPVIYVKEPRTKWEMSLTPNPADAESMFIQLQRLEYGSGPLSVRVGWLMTLVAKKGEEDVIYNRWDRERSFKMNELNGDILEREHIKNHTIPPYEDKDTFHIRIQMFVSHEKVNAPYPQFNHDNFTNLQDFISDASEQDYDIEIVNRSHKIKAHKEVLSSRSGYFKNHIKPGTTRITLDHDEIEFANIIAYLYSNDLGHVLSKPNSVLYESIQQLDIEELRLRYFPTLIKLNTAQDVQYDEFLWVIKDVSKIKDDTIFTSPIMYDSSLKTSWKLELQIKVVKTNMILFISATATVDVNTRMLVHFEFVALGKHKYFQKVGGTGFIEGEAYIDKNLFFKTNKAEIRRSLVGDELHIIFKLQMLLSRTDSKRKNRAIYFLSK